jgi:hypothetical protein
MDQVSIKYTNIFHCLKTNHEATLAFTTYIASKVGSAKLNAYF